MSDKKILVTGVTGQLGFDVCRELTVRGIENLGIGSKQLDITDENAVMTFVKDYNPDAIVHCAAWTAVDNAEDEENFQKVYSVNRDGAANMAKAAKAVDAEVFYISTDYVYSGEGTAPFAETDKPSPVNVYGKSKYEGELAVKVATDKHYILRTSWVFGINGKNFVKTMLNLSDKYSSLRVVNDQIGSPTYTTDLTRLIADMLFSGKYGTYNATNGGDYVSWCDFAKEIFRQAGKNVDVTPVTTEEYGVSKAKRPYNSRMSKEKLVAAGFQPLPTWENALQRYLLEINQQR